MSSIKAQAIEMLQDIPDEKLPSIIEILKGLRLLYLQNENPDLYKSTIPTAMGIFNKYADVNLIPMEKEAWGEAVKEKYAVN
jgi:hypothetical protein